MTGGGWGNNPWGSWWGTYGDGGGPESIPFTDEWDVFDLSGVRQSDDMERIQVFIEVSSLGDGSQFFVASFNMCSGGTFPDSTAILLIDRAVTESFTIEYRVRFNNLPPDFSDVVTEHIYLGAWSSQDYAAGFFFSQQGIQYTGEVEITGGNISPVQVQETLPGSADWITAGVEYVIRVALNPESQLVYLFITKAEDIDNGLPPVVRAILVAKPTVALISDNIHISCRGTALNQSCIELFNYQMSSKFLVGNLAPIALAGDDQAIRKCGIVQLDGSQSFDPEGQALTYEWRLIDAPQGSMFIVEGVDGTTVPEAPPTGYTNRFYSQTLRDAEAVEPIALGDVITLVDGSLTIIGKGTDGFGDFYVDVEYDQIQDNHTGTAFKLVRQAGINGRTTVNPTFYPDVLGFYTFDLRVNDGELSSAPMGINRSKVLINVVESPLPRGCPVDASFIFNYLLSFWRLIEDRDRIATFFEATSRVAATELFTLWQLEYSKSLRDIQRQFIRRWLHYDLLLPEPLPELTTYRSLWSGVRSNPIQGAIAGVGNSTLVVSSPRLAEPVEIVLGSPGPVEPERYARELQVRLRESVDPSFVATVEYDRAAVYSSTGIDLLDYPADVSGRTLSVSVDGAPAQTAVVGSPGSAGELLSELQAALTGALVSVDSQGILRVGSPSAGSSSAVLVDSASTLLTTGGGPVGMVSLLDVGEAVILVNANYPFTFTSLSTSPGFSYPKNNTLIGGVAGQKVAERTFRVSHSLAGYALQEDDLLVIEREAYRIVRVIDSPDDSMPFQRVVVKDPLPSSLDPQTETSPAPLVEWVIPGWVQSEFLNFYAGLVDRGDHLDFEAIFETDGGQVTELVETTAIGVNANLPKRLGFDSAALGSVTTGAESALRLARVIRRHYLPVDGAVVDVPILSEVIEIVDTEAVLRRNVDFFIEEFRGQNSLHFSSGVGSELGDVWEGDRPPDRLWAEYTYLDNESVIEANFGVAIGLTRDKVPDGVDYLSAVRGIWYALYNGPTMRNLRIAVQIFLGLPFAEVAGTILEIRTDFFSQRSRILIQDADNPEIVRSYVYPRLLEVEENPSTGKPYVVGDSVAEFAPLVTGAEVIDYIKEPDWFRGLINQGIFSEVQKYHTFLVRVSFEAFNLNSLIFAQSFVKGVKPVYTDPLYLVVFRVSGDGDEIDVIDTIEMNLTLRFQDSLCDRMGASTTWDQPWPGGAAYGKNWRNAYDTDDDPTNAPPTQAGGPDPVHWGFDKEYICPDDIVTAEFCEDYSAEIPRFDSVWKYDTGAIEQLVASTPGPLAFPQTFSLGNVITDGTLSRIFLHLNGDTGTITEANWVVELLINSVVEATVPLTLGRLEWQNPGPTEVLVNTIEQNVEVSATVNVPVLSGQSVALRVRSDPDVAQTPSWTSFDYAVNVQLAVWQFDTPVTGTFCSYTVIEEPSP